MREALTIPLTSDLLARIAKVRARIDRGDPPRDVAYAKTRLAHAEANAEALYVMFGGRLDQGSVDEAVSRRMELDAAYLREARAT